MQGSLRIIRGMSERQNRIKRKAQALLSRAFMFQWKEAGPVIRGVSFSVHVGRIPQNVMTFV